MKGRHPEKAFAVGRFEVDHLDDIRESLQHIDQSHQRDDQGDVQGKGQTTHRPPQEQGAGVPHEHLGWMEVIDQKGGQAARQGRRHHRQVAAVEPGRHRHIEEGDGDGDPGGQPVDAVRQVHCVDGSHHDEGGEDHIDHPWHGQLHIKKGDVQTRGQISVVAQQHGERHRRRQLEEKFLQGRQPLVGVMAQLLKVIHKANGSKHQSEEVHEEIDKVPPLDLFPARGHNGHPDPQDKHQSAHGGRSLLGHVPGGSVLPDALPRFPLAQQGDQDLSRNKGHSKGHDKAENI